MMILSKAVRRYGVSKTTIRARVASGEIGSSRLGRSLLVSVADIERLIRANAGTAHPRPPGKGGTRKAGD